MAHRVAELMDQAENAPSEDERQAAQNECSDLILKLWEKRIVWPHGGPLKFVLPALRKLTLEPPSPHGWGWNEPRADGSWARLLPQIKHLQARESRVCLFACFADIPKEANEHAREWLSEMGEELSDEERSTMEWLMEWTDRVHAEDFELDGERIPFFGSLSPEERTRHIHAAMGRINKARTELMQNAASRNEQLQMIDPNPMHGNIDSREELHGEYFDQLYNQIDTAIGDHIGEAEEDDEDVELDLDNDDDE